MLLDGYQVRAELEPIAAGGPNPARPARVRMSIEAVERFELQALIFVSKIFDPETSFFF